MAVTYTATFSDGFTTTRTSARHLRPLYTYAIRVGSGRNKHDVAYSTTRALASKRAADRYTQPGAEIVPVTAVVKLTARDREFLDEGQEPAGFDDHTRGDEYRDDTPSLDAPWWTER